MVRWWSSPTAYDAYILSVVSLVVTLVAAVGGLVAYKLLDDSLLFVYGFENCVDFISSAIVVWRFNRPNHTSSSSNSNSNPNSSTVTTNRAATLEAREQRADVAISMILTLLGIGSIIAATLDFKKGHELDEDEHLWSLYYLAFGSLLVFGGFAMLKFRYADALNSKSLHKDGVCSLIGATLALSLFFNTVLNLSTEGMLWWLDPGVAVVCGVGSLGYGLYSVYGAYVGEGLPVFTCAWWIYSDKGERSSAGCGVEEEGVTRIKPRSATPDVDELELAQTTTGNGGTNTIPALSPPASSFTHSSLPPSSATTTEQPPQQQQQHDDDLGNNNEDAYGLKDKVDITAVDLT